MLPNQPNQIKSKKFIIGDAQLFSKETLTPYEFGRDIANLGLNFGMAQLDHYKSTKDTTPEDAEILQKINSNPGFAQLLWFSLITGSFLCYAKLLLAAPNETLHEVISGINDFTHELMQGIPDNAIKNQVQITINFSIAIEREVLQLEEKSSVSLLFTYINNFYNPEINSTSNLPIPHNFHRAITGLGSRFMAICKSEFNISLTP